MKYINISLTLALATILSMGLISCDLLQDSGYNSNEAGLKADTDALIHNKKTVTTGDYPGQPAPGTLFWGAAIGGNSDPEERHEIPSGEILSLRRTFWRWDQSTSNMINTATTDLANGRLPWISVKPPNAGDERWQQVANGQHDNILDNMLQALDALDGPVWLTIHHEPENDDETTFGTPADHLAMNQHVRERMTSLGTDNIALVLILMSWTWDSRSGRDPHDWWASDTYDFLGIDHYRDSEGSLLENGEPTPVWPRIRTWAETQGVDVSVGEWGMRGIDQAAGQRVLEWYEHAANSHNDGEGARVIGLSAFDSGLNAPTGSWELKGEQLAMFQQLMGDPRTACIDDPSSVQHEMAAVASGNSLAGYPAENAIDGNTDTR